MPLPVIIRIHETAPPEATKRASAAAQRHAYETCGEMWFHDFFPIHFTAEAREKYGYAPRKHSTLARKIRAAAIGKAEEGGQIDDVWSGLMRRALLGHHETRAFPLECKVRMFGPHYIDMSPPKTAVDKAREMTTVTGDEQASLEEAMGETFVQDINQVHEPKTTVHQ